MKRIRFKKDIFCRLTVSVDGEDISLESSELVLIMIRPDRSRVQMDIDTLEDNVIHFRVTPTMQNGLGIYSFELWRDIASGYQSVCDIVNAFRIVPLSIQEGGVNKDDLKSEYVDLQADFTGDFVIVDNLESERTDAALSANQGRILAGMISDLDNDLATEKQEREDADNTLQDNIDAEASAREDTDTALQNAIDAEAAAREDADNTLQDNIDALEKSASETYETKTDADAAHKELQSNIDSEASAREDTDTALQNAIDAEAAAREDADTALRNAIDAEAAAREDADNTLQDNIDAEAAAREDADDELTAKFNQLAERLAFLRGDTVSWITTDEYLVAFTDSEDNLLFGITKEGKLYLPVGLPEGIVGLADILADYAQRNDIKALQDTCDKLQEEIDNLEETGSAIYETKVEAKESYEELQANIDKKQNVLTPGEGINIVNDVISSTINTDSFVSKEEATKEIDELEQAIAALESSSDDKYETKEDAEEIHTKLQEDLEKEEVSRSDADDALSERLDEIAEKISCLTGDTVKWETSEEGFLIALVDSEDSLLLGITDEAKLYIPIDILDGITDPEKSLRDVLGDYVTLKYLEEYYYTAADVDQKLLDATQGEPIDLSGYLTKLEAAETYQPIGDYATKNELPTKTSELTNDSGFITSDALDDYAKTADIPSKTSELTNDSGYLTEKDLGDYVTSTDFNKSIDAEAAAREDADDELTAKFNQLAERLAFLRGDTVSWITTDEYLVAFTDSEDNLLFGITKEGKLYLPVGLPEGIVGLADILADYAQRNDIKVLQDAIDTETTARQNADNTLQSNIDSEASARSSADNTLQDNIDALEKSASETYETKTDADAAHKELQSNIDSEASARSSADNTLQTSVDNESTARADADERIENSLGEEAETRGKQVAALTEALSELKDKLKKLIGDAVSWQSDDEYLAALVDGEDNLLFGVTKDARVYIPVGLPDGIVGLKDLLEKYTLIKEEDGVITIGVEREEEAGGGYTDAYVRVDTNNNSVTLHTHYGAADFDVVLAGTGSLTFNGSKFMTEDDIAEEEKQWLVTGNYLSDPQVPRTALRPQSGTPKVGDVMYGAAADGRFLCAEITGMSTSSGTTMYDYEYLD